MSFADHRVLNARSGFQIVQINTGLAESTARFGISVGRPIGLIRDGGAPRNDLDGWRFESESVVRFGEFVQYLKFAFARIVDELSHPGRSEPIDPRRVTEFGRRK